MNTVSMKILFKEWKSGVFILKRCGDFIPYRKLNFDNLCIGDIIIDRETSAYYINDEFNKIYQDDKIRAISIDDGVSCTNQLKAASKYGLPAVEDYYGNILVYDKKKMKFYIDNEYFLYDPKFGCARSTDLKFSIYPTGLHSKETRKCLSSSGNLLDSDIVNSNIKPLSVIEAVVNANKSFREMLDEETIVTCDYSGNVTVNNTAVQVEILDNCTVIFGDGSYIISYNGNTTVWYGKKLQHFYNGFKLQSDVKYLEYSDKVELNSDNLDVYINVKGIKCCINKKTYIGISIEESAKLPVFWKEEG